MKKKSDKEILETFPKRYVAESGLDIGDTPVVITNENITYWQKYFKKTDLLWLSGEKIVEHPDFKSNILLRKHPNNTCVYIRFDQLYNCSEFYDIYHKAINYIIIDY